VGGRQRSDIGIVLTKFVNAIVKDAGSASDVRDVFPLGILNFPFELPDIYSPTPLRNMALGFRENISIHDPSPHGSRNVGIIGKERFVIAESARIKNGLGAKGRLSSRFIDLSSYKFLLRYFVLLHDFSNRGDDSNSRSVPNVFPMVGELDEFQWLFSSDSIDHSIFSNFYSWLGVVDDEGSLHRIQAIAGKIVSISALLNCVLSRTHLEEVNDEQTNGGKDGKFFPKWGAFLTFIGTVFIWLSWDDIRYERRLRRSAWIFAVGVIMFAYGFARLITL